MAFRFETLTIWQKAFDLADEIHQLVIKFPKFEMFSLSNQMRRAADSVVLNICEGSTGLSKAEFARFLTISMRSAIEVVGCLMLAKRRSYLEENDYLRLYDEYDHLCRMITKFKHSLS